MKIAVIGSGIAGNVAAWHLCREHDITVYEAGDHVGGHTDTHCVQLDGNEYHIDTGFIVYNDWTYPNFIKLLNELGVESQPTEMSFSSRCLVTGIEYNGSSLNSLFAQRRNLLRPRFHRMIRDILHFNREATRLLDNPAESITLGEFLQSQQYSRLFIDNYIIPMGAAIWSTDPGQMLDFPARYFVRFFSNHGLLNIRNRPQWHVITGGSHRYVKKITEPYRDRIRLREAVTKVTRHQDYVEIRSGQGNRECFDHVFIASHSDQALAMLSDASLLEHNVLGAIRYQKNAVVLHTDTRQLPHKRRTWAAWNYLRMGDNQDQRAAVTYNMNLLQGIQAADTFCVTLNNTANIDPEKILLQLQYEHPVFTTDAVTAQKRQEDINGQQRTWFCGAYWGSGFHEDGVVSALNALTHFGKHANNAQLSISRAG